MSERVEVYFNGGDVSDNPANAGLKEHGLEPLMRRVHEADIAYRLVDVSSRSTDELRDEYILVAVVPSVRKRYRGRRCSAHTSTPAPTSGEACRHSSY